MSAYLLYHSSPKENVDGQHTNNKYASFVLVKELDQFEGTLFVSAVMQIAPKPRIWKSVRHKCRICWKQTGCVLLFNNQLRPNIDQEIYSFTGVLLRQSKNSSDYICMSCVDLLDSSIRFRSMCKLNNVDFIQYAVKHENSNMQTPSEEIEYLECTANISKKIADNTTDELCNKHEEKSHNYVKNSEKNCFNSHNRAPATESLQGRNWNSILRKPCSIPGTVQFYYRNVAIKRKCRHCNKTFLDLHNFYSHLKCQSITNQPQSTKVHNYNIPSIPAPCFGTGKSKNEEMPHLCDTCGKTFTNYIRLRAHMVIHENIFPFKCDKCPYKGRTRSLLMSHMKSHLLTSERAFKCPHCQKITTTRTNLNAHIQRMHSTNERKYKCTHCEKMFKCKSDLKRHFVIVHENRGAIKCEICFKVFNKKHLKKHLWRIHKIQSEKSHLPNRLPSYILCNRKTEQIEQLPEQNENIYETSQW